MPFLFTEIPCGPIDIAQGKQAEDLPELSRLEPHWGHLTFLCLEYFFLNFARIPRIKAT